MVNKSTRKRTGAPSDAARLPAVAPAAVEAAAPPPTGPSPTSLALPVQHYLSRVPLQLGGILFVLIKSVPKTSVPLGGREALLAAFPAAPVSTLAYSCVGLVFIQVWMGSWFRSTRRQALGLVPKAEVREKRGFIGAWKDMGQNALSGKVPAPPVKMDGDLSYLTTAALATLGAAVILHVCAVLLGAPLLSKIPETFLLSLLVSLLAITPLALTISPTTERLIYTRIISTFSPSNDIELALVLPAIGAIAGCWSGALPIPLDWDEPWQAWPTTCVLGSVGGHALGSFVAMGMTMWKAGSM